MFKGEAPDVSRMWTDSAEEGKEAGLLQAVSWRLTNKMSVLLLMGRGGEEQTPPSRIFKSRRAQKV